MSLPTIPPNSTRHRDGSRWPTHKARAREQRRRIVAMRRPGALVAAQAEQEARDEARRQAQRAAREQDRRPA
jgi:hypothetical protein